MYKNILLFISLVLFFLLIYVYSSGTKEIEKESNTKPIQFNTKENKTFETPTKHSREKSKKSSTPKKTLLSEQKNITIYDSLSLEEAQMTTKVRKHIKPVSAIQMKPNTLKQLRIKDTIVLADIEGVDYPLTVTHIQTHSDGSVTTTGSYVDEGISYTTTMTQSDHESFISLATAQGLYEIETNNGVGYVYKTSDIRKQMQQSTANDVIILPIPQ